MPFRQKEQNDYFQDDSLIPRNKFMRNIFFKQEFWILILIAVQITAIIFLCLFIPAIIPFTLCAVVVWILSVLSALILFARDGEAEVKCVWFVVIAVLPVLGAVLYLLSSVKPSACGILKVHSVSRTKYGEACFKICGTESVFYDEAEYFTTGAEFLASVSEEIRRAKESVYIEFFIIGRGKIFNKLIDDVKKARENGAEIKIIFDGVGSLFKLGKKDLRRLRSAGAEIKIFNKLTPFPHAKINVRDHRKILTVDGRTAFTGGVNIADEYANLITPYGYWKDTGIKVRGQAARVLEGMFLAMWNKKYDITVKETGKSRCLPFYDSPPNVHICEDLYVSAISKAEKRVHIFTPYLCPGQKTAAALSFAAKRGVEVKIIIPHIPDKKYAFEVSKAFAYALKTDGVEIFEYVPGFMHAKTVICDDNVFLGSYNLDYRSAHFNYECGIMFGKEIAEQVEKDFSCSLALSAPLNEAKPSVFKRFYRFLLRFFSPLV